MGKRQENIDFEAKRQIIMENKIKRDVYVFAIAFIVMGFIMIRQRVRSLQLFR